MNWDHLAYDDDDDRFFESYDRISSVVPLDLASSGSDDDEYDDSRMSFASAVSSATFEEFRDLKSAAATATPTNPSSMLENYDMWMAEPGSIKDRRKRLLQGMGLSSNKDLLALTSAKFNRAVTKKVEIPTDTNDKSTSAESKQEPEHETQPLPLPSTAIVLVRSRSDGEIMSLSVKTKRRKEELIGTISKQRLTRTSSAILKPNIGVCQIANGARLSSKGTTRCGSSLDSAALSSLVSDDQFGSLFLIKNLDTGTEFIVKEYNDKGMWNKLSDLQTGKQLTMEEFEKSVGYSPVVKELMRRENVSRHPDDGRKVAANSYFSKSLRMSKRRGVALLKNIKGVANTMSGLIADKEREQPLQPEPRSSKNSSSQWVKVRQHGKPYKEFTGLHLCQEIQAHEGSIWTIKFSWDARFLASAGEDRIIHVWEVQECEVMSAKPPDDLNSVSSTPLHPMACSSPDRPPLAEITPLPSERRKKGKNSSKKKGKLNS